MSLFDAISRRAPDRLRRVMLLSDAARRLGPDWIMFRLRYALQRRFGMIERRSPQRSWPDLTSPSGTLPSIIDVDTLAAWLGEHVDDTRRAQLVGHVGALRARRFDVFGTVVQPDDWHHDPYSGVRYPRTGHWSRVGECADADIKRVWEPSRFGWAFDLVRAQLVAPESGAADLFWELLDEWSEQNPPNTGVNWSCGQESSFRLMSIVGAASAFRVTATDIQVASIERFVSITADRVRANIAYARSQKNNHHASEAVGLLTAGLLFTRLEGSASWRETGQRHLREVCESLILSDGGSSQYSMNYHRVFVHDLVWATQCYRTAAVDVPPWLHDALDRSSRFLTAMVEPISGSGPFFGPDDGARILPLSCYPHRSLEADAVLARACVTSSSSRKPTWEPCAWFGVDDTDVDSHVVRSDAVWFDSFPDMGIHVLGAGTTRAYIIGVTYRFRPTQDDALHCDIWFDGVNCVFDAGTQSYAPRPGDAGQLADGSDHNGPRPQNNALMPKAGRFLWSRWPSSSSSFSKAGVAVTGNVAVSGAEGLVLKRVVGVEENHVRIVDSSNVPFVVSWATDRSVLEVRGGPRGGDVEMKPVAGFVSPGYGRATAVQRRSYTASAELETTVRPSS